jgi:hypothetical protein
MVVTVLLFGVPELIALFTNQANTLSDYSWDELDVHGFNHIPTVAWYASLIVWLIFVVVITAHIWWKGF